MVARWEPRKVLVVSDESNRSAELLEAVLAALQVETEPRYRANGPITYCNLAAWDATNALGAEVPHWHLDRELTANGMILWLASEHGLVRGWARVGPEAARIAAGRGEPVVACWENPHGGHGHIAIVRPSPAGSPLLIWQAGARNFESGPLETGFGRLPVVFFAHP